MAHAVILAGVVWLARQPPAAPSAQPESPIGMVFMPREAALMPAAAQEQTTQLADAGPDLLPPPPPPALVETAQSHLTDAAPAPPTALPAPRELPSPADAEPETLIPSQVPATAPAAPPLPPPPSPAPALPRPRLPVRPARAAEIPRTGPSPAPALREEVAASLGARPSAPILPPRPIGTVAGDRPPAYPEMARRRGEQGDVILRVNVDANGLPLAVVVRQSSGHPSLDDAAVGAVRQWRFQPATQGGQPVVATAEIPVQFRLEN